VKLGRLLGRIGFCIGFIGPLLFYASPPSLFAYESHVLCPDCPYVEVAFNTPMDWALRGLEAGLVRGLVFAVAGFVIGYVISRVRGSRPETPVDSGHP
jgi:hypothetical protein